jgi:hypothetical protein
MVDSCESLEAREVREGRPTWRTESEVEEESQPVSDDLLKSGVATSNVKVNGYKWELK